MPLRNSLTQATYRKMLFPLMIEQLFMMLIGNVNVYLFSLYSDQAVAATGLADQILAIGTMAMGIISLGSVVLFLQNADDKKLSYIQGVTRQTIVLNFILSALLFFTVFLFGEVLLGWMQTPVELRSLSSTYLRIVSSSLLFQGISTSTSALLRSYGKVNIAMAISVVNTLITISGNALVILTPLAIFGEGVVGISVATVVTRFIGAVISMVAIRTHLPKVWDGLWRFGKEDKRIAKSILKLGIPSGMENVSYNFSQTIITAVIASLGAVAINAKIYTQTITAIVFTISVAAGQAGQILIGKYIREKDYEKAQHFALQNTGLFMGIAVLMNILLALAGPWLIHIFTTDPTITAMIGILLWMNVLYDPFRVGNEILIANLNVKGDVRYPVLIGLLVTYLFTVPASILFAGYLNGGLFAVWVIFILDEGMRAFIFYRRWKKGIWKIIN